MRWERLLMDQIEKHVDGSVTGTELPFDSKVSNVEVGYFIKDKLFGPFRFEDGLKINYQTYSCF